MMNVIKYGAEVTVKAPEFLKQAVKEEVNKRQKILLPHEMDQ